MEIVWYGLSYFRMSERGVTAVATDPYPPSVGLTCPRPRAGIITVSHSRDDCSYVPGVRGPFKVLDGPGEYEIGGVFITGIATYADGKRGANRGRNTVFTYEFDGLTICHLGRLGHVPSQSQVEDLGTVNVLLVPVGGGGSLTPARASEVISLFEPNIVVPMYYKVPGLEMGLGTLKPFLKEMGLDRIEKEESLRVTKAGLPEETKVVALTPRKTNGG